MAVPRRMWDSSVVLSYLSGDYPSIQNACNLINQQGQRGELEILVSTIAQAEAALLKGLSDIDSEAKIKEFFSREYIIPVAFDITVAEEARRLIRKYRPGFQPFDAAHMATALLNHIPILETTDPDLLKLNEMEGNPKLKIRLPLYEGTLSFPMIR